MSISDWSSDVCSSDLLCYDGPRAPSLVEVAPFLFERALMINGTSKAYAMTGWPIGYDVGPAQLIEVIVKMIGQSTTCASWVGQAAALVALTSDQACVAAAAAMYRSPRDRLLEHLPEQIGQATCRERACHYV